MNGKKFFWETPSCEQQQQLLVVAGLGLAVNLAAALLIATEQWVYLLGAAGAVLALALLCARPLYILLLVFAFLPFQSLLNDLFARTTALVAIGKDVLMVLLVAALVLQQLIRRQAWYLNTTIRWFLLFAVLSVLYAVTAPSLLRGVLELRFLALYPALIVLAAHILQTRAEVQTMLRLLAVVGLVTVVYGFLQYLFLFDVPYRISGGDVRLRMGRFDELGAISTFASRPTFGGYLAPLFLLFWQVPLGAGLRRLRLLALGAIPVCVLLTFSRSSWLALLVGVVVTLFLRDRLKAVLSVLLLGLGLGLFYTAQWLLLPESLATAATSAESFQIRLGYWPLVLRHVLSNPLGIGLGMVGGPHLFEAAAQADSHGQLSYDPNTAMDVNAALGPGNMLAVTDNAFLKLLVQGGWPLLLAFLCLIGAILRLVQTSLRQTQEQWRRDLAVWAAGSWAALLTIFMFVDFLESAPAVSLYWLAAGVLCSAERITRMEQLSRRQKVP